MDTSPQETNMQNNGVAPQKGGLGSLIGIIIILAVLALGGWYFWNMKMSKTDTKNPVVNGPQIKSSDLSKDLDVSAEANIDAEMNDISETLK